ncbi:MAG: DUF2142 domain-containing protein, partial [Chloroflexota bacterium]|nr:DUF2142 domain-containing protein [Chloroflexota bacterium]
LRLRLLGVALGALTLAVAYLAARCVLPPALAVSAPAAIAGVPMFSAVSASVSADPLANLLAAILLLLLLRPRRPLILGLALGAGVLTKLALAMFLPLAAWRCPRQLLMVAAIAAVVVSPWLVHQVSTYGWSDPLAIGRHSAVVGDQPRFTGLTPDYLWSFLTITFHSFWAQFGWMAIVAPDRLYWSWAMLVLVAAAGLIRRPEWVRQGEWRVLVATVLMAAIGYVSYNLAFTQFQGRYLFPALTPLACLWVRGWSAWLPEGSRGAGVYAVASLLLVLNAYTLTRVLVLAWTPLG